ncbi:TylF/MycF/NovP-related O-methyltransferase [Caenimonas sp. SL110]|uniref:TylF/MycF/NovP-related O-methyltransferase n=1 Tax=Caenimonas sp. SL110 TaxID=1450524 RepID=UPI00065414B7|nr:TylF/MycF/NovP-related O-methyltransferase [Caenimonas sp. SL110]
MNDTIKSNASTGEISPTMHDPRTQAQWDYASRQALESYFNEGAGSATEKLENFAKYVPRQNLARFLARYEIFKLIKDVQGSIVECGVLFGGGLMSFAKLSTILEPYNFQRRIVGFDSFTGFPSIAEEDLRGLPDRKSAHLKQSGFAAEGAYEDIQRAIELYNISRPLNHFPKVQIVKGDFAQTSAQFLRDHPHFVVSCLYLDFDIYEPTKVALEQFLPRMPKGSVLVFDELNEEAFPGETIAVMESLNLNTLRVRRFDFEPRISYAVIGD